jgi:hypothetical protein
VKTQIIQLHKNDDTISVRDKMSWSQTGRILLVWPGKGLVLNRRLDLILVKRHANKMGAKLAFVTNDSNIRFIADQIGIPVFDNLRHAQKSHWRNEKREIRDFHPVGPHPSLEDMHKSLPPQAIGWLDHPVTRIIAFGVSVLALFALGIYILPGATIYLTPQEKTQSMTLSLTADPSITDINLSTGSLPTYSQDVIVEGSETSTVSGSVIIPDQVAIGGLRFTNISDREITIPSGIVVTTLGSDPIRFITTSQVEVEVQSARSVVLSARSIHPGTSGNLPPNSLVAIEGELGLDLSVTNPYTTHGGTNGSVPSPTNQDISILRAHLIEKLKVAALVELQAMLPTEDTLITPTLKLVEIIDETATPARGEPGNQQTQSMRIRFQSQVVSGKELQNLVIPILDANTPTEYSPIITSLVLDQLTIPTLGEDGNAHWSVRAQRKLQAYILTNQAINLISGLTIPQSIDRLDSLLPLAAEARIIVVPKWWPHLPLLPMRIQVTQLEIK